MAQRQPARPPTALTAPITRAVARGVASRWRLRAWLANLGFGLSVAGGVGIVLVVAARGLATASWVLWAVLGLAGAAVAGSIVMAMLRTSRLDSAAAAADDFAGSKDALASALQLATETASEDPAFAALAVARAEGIAAGVKPSEVAPVRLGRWWLAWPGLLAAAIVSAVVPAVGPERDDRAGRTLDRHPRADRADPPEHRRSGAGHRAADGRDGCHRGRRGR